MKGRPTIADYYNENLSVISGKKFSQLTIQEVKDLKKAIISDLSRSFRYWLDKKRGLT